jgi:hypothetical protein
MASPVPTDLEDSEDRMIIRLDPGGPIDLEGLGASFAALARYYGRHYHGPATEPDAAPRLFISRLENGSIVAEIVPYIVMMGHAVPFMQQAMVIADFTKRIAKVIRAYSGEGDPDVGKPSRDDAQDIREFIRPLTGRRGAGLQISHARYEHRDGKKETVIEYSFEETELNRAALTIDAELATPMLLPPVNKSPAVKPFSEVMLFFQQASRAAGKSEGRTADKAIVPAVSAKPLPVYFQKDADLKDQMVRGQTNPLTDTTFVVDVDVQMVDGEPKGYLVTQVHRVIPGDEA